MVAASGQRKRVCHSLWSVSVGWYCLSHCSNHPETIFCSLVSKEIDKAAFSRETACCGLTLSFVHKIGHPTKYFSLKCSWEPCRNLWGRQKKLCVLLLCFLCSMTKETDSRSYINISFKSYTYSCISFDLFSACYVKILLSSSLLSSSFFSFLEIYET